MLTVVALVGAVACSGGDSSTGPSNRDPSGLYALQQVDRDKIPAEVFRGNLTVPDGRITINGLVVTVTGGELILDANGQIHAAIDYRATAGRDEYVATDKEEGTYEIAGGEILISSAQGGGMRGSYRNGTITLTIDLMRIGDARKYTFRYVP
jgi:hypothetical protein